MKIEQKINSILQNNPKLKKTIKRLYQFTMYSISKKNKSIGNIQRLTPQDEFEYFFGYYDKSPWDSSERFILGLRVENSLESPAPSEQAEIIMIDTDKNYKVTTIDTTKTWNIQQGAMLQWIGPKFNEEIIYNDFIDGEYVSVIQNVFTKEKKYLEKPVYSVSNDGSMALTLDFSRLHRLRPGYGYSNKNEDLEEYDYNNTCIWSIDLRTNEIQEILSYKDFIEFESKPSMVDAEHRVNHIMINDSRTRFMVLHRWTNGKETNTRLVTINLDGSDMYNLSDEGMVSHCSWKSDTEILAYAHKNVEGNGYFLMKDKTASYEHLWKDLSVDGHPSYDPRNKWVVTDTYPDRKRMASVYILGDSDDIINVAQVFAPFKYDNEFRCDLHPRWNRTGTKICIDSVFEGKRAMYSIDVKNIVK